MPNIDPLAPPNRKPWFIAAAVCIVIGLVGYGGYRAYLKWQPERLARQAQVFVEKGDYRNAALTVRRALQINSHNVNVCRTMARIVDKAGSPESVFWWRSVVSLSPSKEDCLAYAASALRFSEPAIAAQALATVPEADRHSVDYQSSAGAVASALGKSKEALDHYAEALKLDPQSDQCALNLAVAQLASKEVALHDAGFETLERLATGKTYRVPAKRAMVKDLVARKEWERGLALAKELDADPEVQFADRMVTLDLLRQTRWSELNGYLNDLKDRAAKEPENAWMLVSWMNVNGMAGQAIRWAVNLAPEVLNTPQLGVALTACYLTQKDWVALRDFAKDKDWGGLEYLRLACLARALRELGDMDGFRARWNAALTAAVKQPQSALRLAQAADDWGWKDEYRALLWAVAKDSSAPGWALERLYRYYSAEHDTLGMYQVVSRVIEVNPGNDLAKNNYAMFGLLLKSNLNRAFEVARGLYEKDAGNPLHISTYAYALYMQGRLEEAVGVMEKMTESQLATPETAAYYGVLLVGTGSMDKACKYLELAKTAKLLPEETEMVRQARQSLP